MAVGKVGKGGRRRKGFGKSKKSSRFSVKKERPVAPVKVYFDPSIMR